MNAGNVLQSQLQTLSASTTTQTTPVPSTSGQAISEPSVAPEPSVSQTTPASSAQPAGSSSIFSNKLLLIGTAIVIIIIIIIAMR